MRKNMKNKGSDLIVLAIAEYGMNGTKSKWNSQ